MEYQNIMHAEYVALLFKNSNQLILNLEDLITFGLDERGQVK